MTKYIIRRLLLLFPVLIGVSMLTFVMIRMVPGDVATIALGQNATPESLEQFRGAYGLDKPLFDWKPPFGQYGEWVGGFLKGDFGHSYFYSTPVRDEIAARLPVTLELMAFSMVIMLLLAVPAGVIAAVRPNTIVDYAVRLAAVLGLSIPGFWLATLFLFVPAVLFNWMAPTQHVSLFKDPFGNLQQFFLPSLSMAVSGAGGIARLARSSMLEVFRQDYVRTAWAKGLRESTVIWRHVLKNGLIPIVTIVGLQIGGLIGGAVIIENIFVLPGMGQFAFQSILTRDYLGVQAVVVLSATVFVLVNLAIDIGYVWLDPRIRYS